MKNLKLFFIFFYFYNFNSFSSEIVVISDMLEVDNSKQLSEFLGNVHISDQEIEIWSEKISINYSSSNSLIEEIWTNNDVKLISDNLEAFSTSAIYEPSLKILKMKGNVKIKEDLNYAECDEFTLDLKNSLSIMKSTKSNKVKATISKN